jgi:phage shock protein A
MSWWGPLDGVFARGYLKGHVANQGFFARLSNLWTGFLSLWISDMEKDHPEIAYENSINGMIEKYTQLKKATAAIIRRREDIETRLKARTKELEQIDADLNTAIETEQDDIAMVLISKKNALEAEVNELNQELEQAKQDAEDAKGSLLNVQAEINKLKSEKDRMLAKMASAKARIQIQDQLEGLSVDAEVKALDNVRDHINNMSAEAKLGRELAGESLDGKLAKLRRQTGDVTAKKQLEELKAKRAAAKAAQKTM